MVDVVIKDMDGAGIQLICTPAACRVPTELWASIFQLSSSNEPNTLHPKNSLQVNTNVCRTWRDIMESLPILWTDIVLKDCWNVPKKDISTYIATRLRHLSNILRRSRNFPLHIIISADWQKKYSPALLYPFILSLAEHSHRWASLFFTESRDVLVHAAVHSALSSLEIKELPSLESISIDWIELFDHEDDEDLLRHRSLYGVDLPKLRKLYTAHRCFPEILPWDKLKEVEFYSTKADERRRALRLLNNSSINAISVTEGDIIDFEDEDVSLRRRPYTLPSLERLCIWDWDISSFSPMMAPNLKELIIEASATIEDMLSISSFIRRSKCSLSTFMLKSLDDMEVFPDIDKAMIALIRRLSAVETLHIETLHLGQESEQYIKPLAKALSKTKDGRWSNCPSLRHLIVPCYIAPDSLNLFIDMIQKRWQISRSNGLGTSGLCKVEGFWFEDSATTKHSDCMRRLEAMMEEGLCLQYDCEAAASSNESDTGGFW